MKILSTMKTFKLLSVGLFIFGMLLFSACQNDEGVDANPAEASLDVQSLQDDGVAEDIYEDVLDVSNQVLEANAEFLDEQKTKSGLKSTKNGVWQCANVTITIEGNTRTAVIDFGEEGCEGRNGKVRTGKIISTFERRFSRRASRVTTTFENYTVNGIAVAGTKITTNIAAEGETPKHRVEVIGGLLTFEDGTTITWDSQRTRIFQEGFDTPQDISDDIFSVTGQQEGTNRQGASYASRTSSPLIYKGACRLEGIRFPASGIRLVDPFNGQVRRVDFGDGECDRSFTVTVGGRTETITE